MPAKDVDIKADFKETASDSEKEKTIIKMQIGNKRMFTDSEAFD